MKVPLSLFDCDRCGACCTQLIVEIDELDVVREPRLADMAEPFRVTDEALAPIRDEPTPDEDGDLDDPIHPRFAAGAMLACGASRPCPALGADRLCTIYPTRPNVCVAFRAGSPQCQNARGLAGFRPLEPRQVS